MFGLSGATVAGLAGAIGGAAISAKGAKDAAKISAQGGQLDPRISGILFGQTGQQGLLDKYQGLLDQDRSGPATLFGQTNGNYLANYGGADMDASRIAAYRAIQGNSAPTAQAAQAAQTQGSGYGAPVAPTGAASTSLPAYAVGSMVKPPSQNGIDLTGSYNSLLGGGDTSKLMNSLQAGNALTGAQFQQNQANLTDNLTRNVLPSIRSGAIAAGQFGGSRQGIAEGNALSDFTKQLNQSNTQLGLANSANTAGALAGAYENGQNRALSATQGLGAQQYGVASQDANTKNQAEFMNVGNSFAAANTNAGFQQQANLANLANGQFNATQQQQNSQYNTGLQQQNNQFNAGLGQQTNLANLQSQLTNNAQNNSSSLAGAGLLSGLLGGAANTVNANDNWNLTRAQGVNSLLAPYLSSAPTQNPVASNSGAAALGGGLAGLSLGNSLGGLLGGMGNNSSIGNTPPAGLLPSSWASQQQPVQSFPMFTNFTSG